MPSSDVRPLHIKVCGVTTVDDALGCATLGVNAIGLNFIPSSPRSIDTGRAREIARALASSHVLVVGVVANETLDVMRGLLRDAELGCLQLHGNEPNSVLRSMLPHAYKAVRIQGAADVTAAQRYTGDCLLADAFVEGELGGTGASFDWSLVKDLAKKRSLLVAGGLRPTNVAQAVEAVGPYGVDVASGVELAPGIKDLDAVRAFVDAARRAHAKRSGHP